MFIFHPHRKSATKARAAESHRHVADYLAEHLRAARLAVEIAIVISGLALWGLVTTHRNIAKVWAPASEACVYFGRAGGHCPSGPGESPMTGTSAKCQWLGRAGRFCPPGTP